MVSPILRNNSTPRYATKRTKTRKTRGHEIAAIAQLLGTPLLPWQRMVADVGTEMVVDRKTGLIIPAYREICITIPRQSGKTTFSPGRSTARSDGQHLNASPTPHKPDGTRDANSSTIKSHSSSGHHSPRQSRASIEEPVPKQSSSKTDHALKRWLTL